MENHVDFNRHRPPILVVSLPDARSTTLHVTPPTVDLQEELRARHAELDALLRGNDEETRGAMYDLAARIMSCNRNMMKITGEQLLKTYHLDVEDLVVFYNEYADFLRSIEKAKN